MKHIALGAIMTVLCTGTLAAQTFSLEEAIAFLEKNGYEYTIAYDEAVKELPEGAPVFTPFGFEAMKQAAEEVLPREGYTVLDSGDTLASYAYGDVYYPSQKRLMLVAGYERSNLILFVGYKFKWERNTTSNEQSPGWYNITRSDVCSITNQRFGQLNGGDLPDCSCIYIGPGYECYTSATEKILLNYYSAVSACAQCDGNIGVFSVRFSVNPRVITYVWNGYFFVPVYVYTGWISVLTDGDGEPFDPMWDLCETSLYGFCEDI